jgi:hypothetical protein
MNLLYLHPANPISDEIPLSIPKLTFLYLDSISYLFRELASLIISPPSLSSTSSLLLMFFSLHINMLGSLSFTNREIATKKDKT